MSKLRFILTPDKTRINMIKLVMKFFWWLLVRGWIPDWILRWKIRNGLKEMLEKMDREAMDYEARVRLEAEFVKELRESPIAIHQEEANEQHYEVPADFYRVCLGPHLKYSSCYYKVRLIRHRNALQQLSLAKKLINLTSRISLQII